jgi:hypothetical protein
MFIVLRVRGLVRPPACYSRVRLCILAFARARYGSHMARPASLIRALC